MAPHTMWDLLQHSLGSLAPRMQDLGRFVISVGIFTRLGGEASVGATPHAHDGFEYCGCACYDARGHP